MAFERIRTINGHRYLYRETRWREGKKVKSRSDYLGKFLELFAPIPEEDKGLRLIEQQIQEYPRQNADDPTNDALKEKAAQEEGGETKQDGEAGSPSGGKADGETSE